MTVPAYPLARFVGAPDPIPTQAASAAAWAKIPGSPPVWRKTTLSEAGIAPALPHAGFGLGFDRAVAYATGMANIRDVIPFPRTPASADF